MRLQGPNGNVAAVDSTGRLATLATALTADEVLLINGRAFVVYREALVVPGAGYFFYLRNLGALNLAIGGFSVLSSAATRIRLRWVSGSPTYTAATEAVFSNLRLNNPNQPQTEANWDTAITGLTDEGTLAFESALTPNQRYSLDIPGGVSIPTGEAVALYTTAPATLTVLIQVGIITL